MLAAAVCKCQCLGSVTTTKAGCPVQRQLGYPCLACSLKNEPTSQHDLAGWQFPKLRITVTGAKVFSSPSNH